MSKLFQFIIVLALMGLAFLACTHEPYYLEPVDTDGLVIDDGTDPGAIVSSTCDSDTVYFQNQILPIFISSCAVSGCHDQTTHEEGLVLTNYDNIMRGVVAGNPSQSKYYKVITLEETDDLMPQDPTTGQGYRLPDEQIALIKKWIEQQAYNNYCEECDTTDYTFSTRISPIVGTSCATSTGCHASGSSYGEFTSYNNIKPYVDNGSIYDRVITQKSMPPSGALPECDIEVLKKWIEAGAPND